MAVHTEKIDDAALETASKKAGLPKAQSSLVELGMEFARAVQAKGDPSKGLPADKEFIDSLYGDGNFALTDIESA